MRAGSVDIESRTVMADITTETPVPMPDWEHMAMVPEVLLSSGAQLPKSRQVPFLDSHNHGSVNSQLGSARDVKIEGDRLTAKLHFAETASAQFGLVREGHVTDVSAGYDVIKRVHVAEKTTKTIDGREYHGPMNIVTKWRLREVSLTPIGADQQAKLRGLDPAAGMFRTQSQKKENVTMTPALRALLITRGMVATLSEEEADAWLVTHLASPAGDQRKAPVVIVPDKEERKAEPAKNTDQQQDFAALARDAFAAVAKEERARILRLRTEADTLCDLARLPDEKESCRAMDSVEEMRTHLLSVQKTQAAELPSGAVIRVTGEGADRFMGDIRTALTMRALSQVATPAPEGINTADKVTTRRNEALEKVFPAASRSAGAEQWRQATMYEMAEEMVRNVYGIPTRGMARNDVAVIALFGPQRAADIGIQFRNAGLAYHTTGSFANLTLDAQNKSMQMGYTETPSTWEGPMKRGASVSDFKNVHRMRLGSIPNLPIWNDNDYPMKASMADGKETYAVESRSVELDFSYKLLVNDDMGLLGPGPAQLGAAARRTVNAFAWSLITSNPTMSDGKAVFLETAAGNRKRSNLTTGSAVPTNLTLQTMKNKMRQMRGENTPENAESQDILNLTARYIVGPGALDTTILQLVLSVADPVTQMSSSVYNPAMTLIPVIEPLLDVASATAWYLFCDPGQMDTVEISFLQGQETPVLRSSMNERSLSQCSTILQTFGGAPMNHRGMQKHDGA